MHSVKFTVLHLFTLLQLVLVAGCSGLAPGDKGSDLDKPDSSPDPGTAAHIIQDKIDFKTLGPELVLIPAGEFMMGSPLSEQGRDDNESPRHQVSIARDFYLGKTHITVAQFRRFIQDTGYTTVAETERGGMIRFPNDTHWTTTHDINWRHDNRGEPAADNLPVVHVAWKDARAYVDWLSEQTGQRYRLPSEAEIEYANRAGTTTRYWWGDDKPAKPVANLKGELDLNTADKTWYPTLEERVYAYRQGYTPMFFESYGDGYADLAPVASFAANPFGLYDTAGNVWTWTQDCFHQDYVGAPSDGSAWIDNGDCYYRIVRGGSYYCFPKHVRSSNRWYASINDSVMYIGFRVARDK